MATKRQPKRREKGVYWREERQRWYIRWRDSSGRLQRRVLGEEIKTLAQANRAAKKFHETRREQKLARIDPNRLTLQVFAQEYIEHRKPLNLSSETLRRDEQALNSLAEVIGGNCLLRSINQRRIDEWAGILLSRGVQPTTVNSYLRHIRAALSTAVKWKRLLERPDLHGLKEPKRLPRALMPDEAARILFREKNFERRAMWRFLLWTGCRRQEVVDLDWRKVHLDREEPFMIVVGKGDKERLVPLLPEAVRALRSMPQMDLGKVWRFKVRGPEPVRPVKGWALTSWFKKAARRAGVEDAHLHDLRHTAATWMAARGVSERVIQEILGHASITTTQIYTKGLARISGLYKEASRGLKVSPK